MTKSEIVAYVSEKTGLKKIEAERAVNAVVDALTEAFKKGERVAIPGLGVFSVKQRKARKGINPKTGDEIIIPEKRTVAFRTAKSLTLILNK